MLLQVKQRYDKLSPRARAHLRSYRDIFAREQQFENMELGGKTGDDDFSKIPARTPDSGSVMPALRGSDTRDDLLHGGLTGFSQDQSSTAWCSPTAVMAFRDTGSYYDNSGLSGLSFARSTNNGSLWTDMGALYSDRYDLEFLNEQVTRCSDQNTFYVATSAIDFSPLDSQITVARSNNAGINFKPPVTAVGESLFSHFLASPWMAVDPTNPDRLYVTYTDFDSTGSTCGSTTTTTTTSSTTTTTTVAIPEAATRIVRSTDRGETWSAPVTIESACDPQGSFNSRVSVGPAGDVNVAWNRYGATADDFEVRFARSTDNGATFNPPVTVAAGTFPGNSVIGNAQSMVYINEAPQLAVDTTTGTRSGRLYMTWTEGTLPWDDLVGTYWFSDVMFSTSADGGVTWSSPTRVNNNPETATDIFGLTIGTDQFHPGLAVDKVGAVGVCFYDRRRDPKNFLMDRYCAKSVNGGATFANVPKTAKPYWVLHSQDMLHSNNEDPGGVNDMGFYDDLASDFRKVVPGFRGGYVFNGNGNPDIRVNVQ